MPGDIILPNINIRTTQSSINNNKCLTTLVLNKNLPKAREITSPIKIKNNGSNSPRSKSTLRLGLCTSPVTKRDLEAVYKHKDSFALLQNSFVSKFNMICDNNNNNNDNNNDNNNNDTNNCNNSFQCQQLNGSLLKNDKKVTNPLSLSLRQTSAEIKSYQEATKRRINDIKKLEIDAITSSKPPPRSGESFDEKQRKRKRMRAETYAINAYLKKIENAKWEKLQAEQTGADDISWCSDDSSVLPTPRYRTPNEKKKSKESTSKTDNTIKNATNNSTKKVNSQKPSPRSFGGV